MQPYFFPYIGYFALIEATDTWVVFDETQYTPKTWMNRNRVLHPSGGWMYVTAELSHSTQNMRIADARLRDLNATRRTVLGKLAHYKKVAPHYAAVIDVVEQTFDSASTDSLVDLNVAGLRCVCEYLSIGLDLRVYSKMPAAPPAAVHPGAWAPAIAESLGASEYVNPVGGAGLFRSEDFERAGVKLLLLEMPEIVYDTGPFPFEPSLSILDVMMWNDVEQISTMLATRTLVAPAWAGQ